MEATARYHTGQSANQSHLLLFQIFIKNNSERNLKLSNIEFHQFTSYLVPGCYIKPITNIALYNILLSTEKLDFIWPLFLHNNCKCVLLGIIRLPNSESQLR